MSVWAKIKKGMKQTNLKEILNPKRFMNAHPGAVWHVVIVAAFLVMALIYCSPVMDGKTLQGHDVESWSYMAKEARDFNAQGQGTTFWTNSMFCGMPTYQISAPMSQNNILSYVSRLWSSLPEVMWHIFMYLIGAYILLLCFKMNKWLAAIGAVALAFVSYNFIILAAGHMTKAHTIVWVMPLVGSVYLLFRGQKWGGAALTAIFLALAIAANHVQILYYTIFIIGGFGVVELVYAVRERRLKDYGKSVAFGVGALLVAVGLNAPLLGTTYEYSKATMRGESNGLSGENKSAAGHGLDKDYITAWSYGVDESMTLLIPDFKGGASGGTLSADSETAQRLKTMGVRDIDRTMREFQLPLYWGPQPFTSGPVYVGAIVCFLFVLGLFLVDKRTKWWLVSVTVLTLMLAWGRHFMPLTDLFIDYVPMYNKFRTVSMILVATCICVGLLGMLGLKAFFDPATDKVKTKRALRWSLYIAGGVALVFCLIPSLSGSFVGAEDSRLQGNYAFLQETLPIDRAAMLRADAVRSLAFIALAFVVLWGVLTGKLKQSVAYALLFVLVVADMWTIDKRYVNDSLFVPKRETQKRQPSLADNYILQDTTYYRVLDATVNIFNSSEPAYFHKCIGGYHAAKLSRYQELIEHHIQPEIQSMMEGLRTNGDFRAVMQHEGVLNMLNMKYLIYDHKSRPLVNPVPNGNAWFVDTVRVAATPDEEMAQLGVMDTKREVVVDQRFADEVPVIAGRDTSASIVLRSYAPNRLVYTLHTSTPQLAIFSEVYYRDGWNAYVDGQLRPHFRANYLLRAMAVEAGDHEVEFRFEPSIVPQSKMVALLSSGLLLLFVGMALYMGLIRRK